MKRFLFIALLLVALLFISCDLFITPSGEETLEISVGTTSGSTSRGSKVPATIFNDLNVNSVKARIFYNSDGVLVPSGSLTLTKTTTNWHGRFEYNPGDITGNVIIHIMGFSGSDGTGAIIWQGSTTSQLITAFENGTVTVPTTHGYDVGNRGPGGGWIIYDKTTFDDTGSKMGKDWRYIEIAAEDLEEDWTSDLIDEASYYVSPTDKKVYRKSDNVLTLDTTDFYWGQAGNFNTLVATQEGKLNTGILVDDMTSATPQKRKGNGRKAVVFEAPNTRRDTAEILATKDYNGFTDWFIPSKDELGSITTNAIAIDTYKLTADTYWTSSEDANTEEAWSVDFSSGATPIIAPSLRDVPSKVRAARAF